MFNPLNKCGSVLYNLFESYAPILSPKECKKKECKSKLCWFSLAILSITFLSKEKIINSQESQNKNNDANKRFFSFRQHLVS